MFENITYNIFQGGKKLDSGCIDHNSPCITSNSIGMLPNSTENYEIDADVDTTHDPSKQFSLTVRIIIISQIHMY